MKTEPASAPTGHTFNTVKDVVSNAKQRMEKAVSDLQHAMATGSAGQHQRAKHLALVGIAA